MTGNLYWQRNTINKILKNEMYTGAVVSGTTRKVSYKSKKCKRVPKEEWIIVPNMHEPIIQKEVFDEVQQLMKKRTSTRERKHDHILKGLIRCGNCGATMTIKVDYRSSTNRINYICSKKNANKMYCNNPLISANIIEKCVLDSLKKECSKIVLKENDLSSIAKKIEKEINSNSVDMKREKAKLEEELSKVDSSIDILYKDKMDGIIEEEDFVRQYQLIKKKREENRSKIEEIENRLNKEEIKKVDYNRLIEFSKQYLSMEKPSKEILAKLIDKITVSPGRKIKIKYKFSRV